MKQMVLILGAVALAAWSLIAWAGHALLVAVGGFGAMNADLLPLPPEWIVLVSESLDLATGLSGVIMVTLWLIGAAVIAVITLVGAFLAGRIGRRDRVPVGGGSYRPQQPAGGYDLYRPDDDRRYDEDDDYRRGRSIGDAIGRTLRDMQRRQ